MASRGADLVIDEIKIIKQPIPPRGNPPTRLDRQRQQVPDAGQRNLVLRQARQELVRTAPGAQYV